MKICTQCGRANQDKTFKCEGCGVQLLLRAHSQLEPHHTRLGNRGRARVRRRSAQIVAGGKTRHVSSSVRSEIFVEISKPKILSSVGAIYFFRFNMPLLRSFVFFDVKKRQRCQPYGLSKTSPPSRLSRE